MRRLRRIGRVVGNAGPDAPAGLVGWAIAEAVRLDEEGGAPIDERHAWQAGRNAGGDLAHRVLARASATRLGVELRSAVAEIRARLISVLLVVLILAMLSGIAAAGVVFGTAAGDGRGALNILWVMGSLLGFQLLMLLLWLAFTLLRPRARGGLLGRSVLDIAGSVLRRLQPDRVRRLAVLGVLAALGREGIARWSAGLLTHLLWASFGVGAVLMSLWTMSLRQYDFAWGTTLLGDAQFVTLIGWLAALPAALGLLVPDEALIRASRLGAETLGEGRRAWSALLIWSLLLYGVLPRMLLAGVCALRLRAALKRLQPDVQLPGFARLAPRLQPATRSLGVVDPDRGAQAASDVDAGPRRSPAEGPVLLVGLALSPEYAAALQRLEDAKVAWLGTADAREQRHDLLAGLTVRQPHPGLVAVVSSLLRTPDRHAQAVLRELRAATQAAVWLLVGETERAASQGIDVALRQQTWQALADTAGVDHVMFAAQRGGHADLVTQLHTALDAALSGEAPHGR
ncbi:MAG: DUF2868 domain-containing protein [Gammaproteobacteria bacterium]|nr:DUF2868 domain-containing protein [Gammaproteobacteria bacterium]